MIRYNTTTYNIFTGLLALMLCGILQSCRDDTFDQYNVQYPDGMTSVRVAFDFEPLSGSRLSGRGTNAPDGNVVKELTDFSVLFYDTRYADSRAGTSGRLTYIKHFSASDIANRTNGITLVEDRDRVDSEASNGNKAEDRTKHVEFILDEIPYGPYKAYVVANLGTDGATTQSVLEANADNIESPEGLSMIKARWDEAAMTNNAQMTGFFSETKQQPSPGTATAVDIVSIRTPNMSLHAWLRRLVSKVTVTYDPSGLRRGITVTIKKVTVRDIASSCYLGMPNKIGAAGGDGFLNTDPLIDVAETSDTRSGIDRKVGNNHYIEYDTPLVLTADTKKGDYLQLDDNFNIPAHSETAKALFFFENMQGEVPDKDHNGKLQDGKLQDENGDGIIDYPGANDPNHKDYVDNKDGLKYGTYIEVEAEYDAKSVDHIGRGTIKYRFMLGKNVTTNCDAERNHHYKLKMRFMGNANEVDWHIDYDEEPGFYGPNPFYVSYLYNQESVYPIKISGTVNGPVTMTVIQNDWSPRNAKDLTYYAKTEISSDSVSIDPKWIYNTEKKLKPNDYNKFMPWYGFLSLAEDLKQTNIGVKQPGSIASADKDYLYYYWMGERTSENDNDNLKIKRGIRTYQTDKEGTFDESTGVGSYRVTKNPESTTIYVPFFTRQKQLNKPTGYTGNNPYVAYQREAKIKIDYSTVETGKKSDTIKVFQVRRIVNPKGVWRSHDNAAPFKVTLMHQEQEKSSSFTAATSQGPWRASIWRGNTSFITLDGKSVARGGNGSEISFTIGFKGTIPEGETRCAIIRVEYHNYSCHHLIFVRQGYAPIRLLTTGKKWHTGNVALTSGTGSNITVEESLTPTDEGSLFRYGNLAKGIVASENGSPSSIFTGRDATPDMFDPVMNKNPEFQTSDGSKTHWNSIVSSGLSVSSAFPDVKIKGRGNTKYSVATYADYSSLVTNDDIDVGYGVLYGDSATTTATDIATAYGFCSEDGHVTDYGMRGAFIYNQSTSTATLGGNNVFFPIGRAGFGHRKQYAYVSWSKSHRTYSQSNGVLQYAGGRMTWYDGQAFGSSTNQQYVPLFYDLFRSNGALYWIKQLVSKGGGSYDTALDINYQTLDFNIADNGVTFGATNVSGYGNYPSDACFVRLVED